jgi:hypothetical protein
MLRVAFTSCTLALVLNAAPARAENLLEGPYPFLHDNELSLHGGFAAGFGDTFGGAKAIVDYGYKLDRGFWLDLDLGFLSGACGARAGDLCARSGDSVEVLAGLKWKLQMNVPVVPYAKLVAGLGYQFPSGGRSAAGPMVRSGIGATYFFYQWIGVGAEVTVAAGHAGYEGSGTLSRALGALDVTLGAELQF